LVYATFIIKVAFPHFAVVLMSGSSLHINPVYSLNPCLLAPDWTLGDVGAILSQPSCNFMVLNVIFIVPLIMYRLTFVVTSQYFPWPICTDILWLMAFHLLASLLCCCC
jgi:hypothetical protein